MFESLADLSTKLAATGYFIDPVMTQVVFLAAKLNKPLLLEGPAGSGKTQLAISVAEAAGTHVERLQCYRGVSEDKAIGRFDEGLQRLYMEFSKGGHENWQSLQANLKGRDFFRPGPLMRALECERPCVLLIDELDKVDDGFEAMLLEILSAWQLSIPEFGTVAARSIPFVVLTSNEERRLGDPIRRRSLYVRVEHPTPQREAEIIASRTPDADTAFHREMAGIALSFRNYSLEKPPSVSEMIDFANALQILGTDHVTEEHRDILLPFLAKTEKDRRHLLLREGFKSLLDDGARLAENTPPDLDIDLLDSVLMEAIASTYKRCSAKSSNPIPLFGDLAAELAHWQDRDRNQKINAMAQMASTKLRAWVDEGPYARLFDRPTRVELTNPWLYFNVEKLKDDPRLERAMSLLIAHTATYRSSGANGQPSIVLLDECWALLESPILASVVVQLFRTARKRNASVWGISQTPEDFVGTPDRPNEHGAGIVKNATTKIIGKQPGDMTALRTHVHLNETALNQVKAFAHPKKGHSAEFLIAIGEKAESTHAIRIVPSPVDYWITTTYARERHFRKWWLQEHPKIPLLQAYEQLADKYPRGLAEIGPLDVELSGAMQEVLAQ